MNQGLNIAGVMEVARASGLLVSLATFQAPTGDLDAVGVATGVYADVAGLTDLICISAPREGGNVKAEKQRAQAEITDIGWQHVVLGAYYPTVPAGWRGDGTGAWRVLIGDDDGSGHITNAVAWDIGGAESSSQGQMTVLEVRLATL